LRAVLHWDGSPIEALLLDLDDTILDNRAGLDTAWREVSTFLALRLGDVKAPALQAQLRLSGDWFWSDPERHRWGRMDMPGARRAVFAHLLESIGRPAPALAAEASELHGKLRDAGLAPFDGALEALARLRERAPGLGLITNGAAAPQRAKIERFELARFFDVIVVEGEAGFGKPDRRVFERALGGLDVDPSRALMAGDNYECDVLGALGAGVHAVWIDRAPGGAEFRPKGELDPRHRTVTSFVQLVEELGVRDG
jgi:putative hydrolase of the HAD superfamily